MPLMENIGNVKGFLSILEFRYKDETRNYDVQENS
jgi:hypothetical protein